MTSVRSQKLSPWPGGTFSSSRARTSAKSEQSCCLLPPTGWHGPFGDRRFDDSTLSFRLGSKISTETWSQFDPSAQAHHFLHRLQANQSPRTRAFVRPASAEKNTVYRVLLFAKGRESVRQNCFLTLAAWQPGSLGDVLFLKRTSTLKQFT